jgi:hypothetical protein
MGAALSGPRTQSLYAVFDHFAEYYWAWLDGFGPLTVSPETLAPDGGNPRARTDPLKSPPRPPKNVGRAFLSHANGHATDRRALGFLFLYMRHALITRRL